MSTAGSSQRVTERASCVIRLLDASVCTGLVGPPGWDTGSSGGCPCQYKLTGGELGKWSCRA